MAMRQGFIKLTRVISFITAAFLIAAPHYALASSPYLAFSDLISGPDTGLGDGQGSGVIVTVWGQNLGDSQGSGKVFFTDASGTKRQAAHVYYWKKADGKLPSGPANLSASHKMQEIAFSIPDSANGLGSINIEAAGTSNSLPFTVRSGNIYHVKSSGSDSGNGSWGSPWGTVGKADATAPAGSTIYVYDVDTGSSNSARGIYWSNNSASSTLNAQFSIVSYPGFQPKVMGQQGISSYSLDALVLSKLDIYSSNYTSTNANGQPSGAVIANGATYGIYSTKDGRAIANRIGDIPGGCASKYQGAIVGSAKFHDYVSNYRILGNEVYEYGCKGSTKLHHTMYMSIRSDGKNLQVKPWEYGYNYLHDNEAKLGIHQFDQDEGCGDMTDVLRIHNNVVVNQAGAGISVGSQCGWSMDVEIENNVLINVGLAAAWDGVDPDSSDGPENGGITIRDSGLTGTMYIRNNLIVGWSDDGATTGGLGCLNLYGSGDSVSVVWSNNVCHSLTDKPFMGAGYKGDTKYNNVVGSNNVWFDGAGSSNNDNIPSGVTGSKLVDPQIAMQGISVLVEESSPLINGILGVLGVNNGRDIYGTPRGLNFELGPVEFVDGLELLSPPQPPSGFGVSIN